MLDSNAFDRLHEVIPTIKSKLSEIDFYVATVQVEEIAIIPDEKRDVRKRDFLTMIELRPHLVPHTFTFDAFDFGHFSFEIEPKYWSILKSTKSNKKDALIAATAIRNGCTLVTNDTELTKKMNQAGESVLSFDAFIDSLR